MLKTAKALGLTIPAILQATADEVPAYDTRATPRLRSLERP
jgi:hypothetical protein